MRVVLLCLLLVGCGDDDDTVLTDAAGADAGQLDATTPDAQLADRLRFDGDLGQLPDVTGRALLAVSTPISPDTPIQFSVEQTLEPNGDGTALLTMTLKPLTVADRMPTAGLAIFRATVRADGSYRTDSNRLLIPGDANPVSGGDFDIELRFAGQLHGPDLHCGAIEGRLLAPFMGDLSGSPYGAVRVTGALPPPVKMCPGDGGM